MINNSSIYLRWNKPCAEMTVLPETSECFLVAKMIYDRSWVWPLIIRNCFTIPEVRRYRSYEEPDETPHRGAQFGSWLPHVMWYFVSQQRGCKWVFVWTLQRSMKFQTRRRRDLHQQAQTNGVVKRSSMGVRAHEMPNQGAQFGKCWHWPALLPLQLASLYSAIAKSK